MGDRELVVFDNRQKDRAKPERRDHECQPDRVHDRDSSGSSYTCATQIPANCIVLSISARVETAITYTSTPTGWACGVSGNSSQFGGSPPGMGFALGTTNFGLIGPTAFYNPTNIILSLVGGTSPTFVGGALSS